MRFIRCADTAMRVGAFDSVVLELTARLDAVRDVVETRFWVAFVVAFSRGFTFCAVVVVRDTVRVCGFCAVLVFVAEFFVLSDLFVVTERVDCCVETFALARLFAVRTVSDVSANVVPHTDKPRHTVKNSIILFIPYEKC